MFQLKNSANEISKAVENADSTHWIMECQEENVTLKPQQNGVLEER